MNVSRPTHARNIVHSLAGQVAPGLAALVAMPLLLQGYGADRLGILHLTWIMAGYFSLLDIGIGRALTHAVAAALARRHVEGEGPVVLAGYVLLGAIGVAGGLVLFFSADWLAWSLFTMGDALRSEAASAFRLLAPAIPFVTLASAGRGVLEGQQRFDLVNAIRVPTGILMFAAPVAVLPFSESVLPAVVATVTVRAITAAGYLWLGWRQLSGPRSFGTWPRQAMGELVSFGAWMAAANLTGTLTYIADRIALGSLVSLAAVTYYATPMEVISRLTVVATALMAVMFPAFSAEHATLGARLGALYGKAVGVTLLFLFPPVLVIVAFTPELLTWWLGAEFAQVGVVTTRLIAAGTLANALAQPPFGLLQATGRARATAFLAAIELPAYVCALWFLTLAWGVEGVALAWAARMTVDAIGHYWLARTAVPVASGGLRAFARACAVSAAVLLAVTAFDGLGARVAVSAGGAAVFLAAISRTVDIGEFVGRARAAFSR